MLISRRKSEHLPSRRGHALLRFIVLAFSTLSASGVIHETFPPPNAPFYARIWRGNAFHDGQWAAIPFWTSPDCVPAGFNLLDLFDIPRAFGCPLNVKGFSIWQNGPPPIDPAPMLQAIQGTGAVHVWFVRWTELEAGMADGVLTIHELRAMPSLRMGLADLYHQILAPPPLARQPLETIVAQGTLQEGQPFKLNVLVTWDPETLTSRIFNVRILFR
jgi:hypothetical protein